MKKGMNSLLSWGLPAVTHKVQPLPEAIIRREGPCTPFAPQEPNPALPPAQRLCRKTQRRKGVLLWQVRDTLAEFGRQQL